MHIYNLIWGPSQWYSGLTIEFVLRNFFCQGLEELYEKLEIKSRMFTHKSSASTLYYLSSAESVLLT